MKPNLSLGHFLLLALLGIFLPSLEVSAEMGSKDSLLQLVTNLAQLDHQADLPGTVACAVRIEGLVWWANPASGRLILADDSGVRQLELDWPCQMPKSGDRLRLAGNCQLARAKDAIKLLNIPVVNTVSDRVYLAADNGLIVCVRDASPKYAAPLRMAPAASVNPLPTNRVPGAKDAPKDPMTPIDGMPKDKDGAMPKDKDAPDPKKMN